MEGAKSTESWDEWERVHSHTLGWEVVSEHGDSSIFPPSKHEGLQTQQHPGGNQGTSEEEEQEEKAEVFNEEVEGDGKGRCLEGRVQVLWSGMDRLATRVRCCGGVPGRGFWVGLLAVGILGYSGMKRRRQWMREGAEIGRLTLLLQEKDQKIGQLLRQVAQLNEMLWSPRKVPVHRVV